MMQLTPGHQTPQPRRNPEVKILVLALVEVGAQAGSQNEERPEERSTAVEANGRE